MNDQLTMFLRNEEIELGQNYSDYSWLKGNPDNLRVFFEDKLADPDLDQDLRIDAELRLEELSNGIERSLI